MGSAEKPPAGTLDEETVQRPMGKTGGGRPESARLLVVFPRHLAAKVPLDERDLVLGRRPRHDERGHKLDDPTVSRRHFAVRWSLDARRHTGIDLGSRNGSRVDGCDVRGAEPEELEDGTVIRCGDVLMVYEAGKGLSASDRDDVSREAIPGSSARAVQLRADIGGAARDPSAVLLTGETGTGKEFIAREIHRLSGRAGSFVAINCAALSPQLVESQLFGHAKGAFTGAVGAHDGLFRAADRGTLFLDEIGELPREMQPKLLRALQEREVHPVGETRPVKVDTRVVSATLRDLTGMIDDKSFRLDLYARLSPWEIRVPALRERRADVIMWVDLLVQSWHAERSRAADGGPLLEANAAERLLLHDWPENLRGLDRLVHRACSEAGGALDVPSPERGSTERGSTHHSSSGRNAPQPRSEGSDEAATPKPTKEELQRVLGAHAGSVRATAKHFGRDRRQIYRWMEQYGLREKD